MQASAPASVPPVAEPIVYAAGRPRTGAPAGADAVTAEVVRHGLNCAAEAMKSTLVRTAMSPIIYETLDFAAVLYDPHMRLLAQAPSMPIFMGTMSFCVDAAVAEVGGADSLEPGDVILMNDPYKIGSHPQDAAVVMPVFRDDGQLVGYSAIKAHWLDIGAKNGYCTDTTDVFQEGLIVPGVKLYRRGELVEDVLRIVKANSRLPRLLEGDLNAEIAGVRAGARELLALIDRIGVDDFSPAVERMYDHGEAVVRSYLDKLPDGRYVARGEMDDDGVSDDPIPFEVAVEIDGSSVRVDFSNSPPPAAGPVNCPLAATVSAARVVIAMLAGGAGEAPNEGHFRPIEVVARPGSMFHCLSPAPCFLYGWAAAQAADVILRAFAEALPAGVPAASGGDFCSAAWYGFRADGGHYWYDGSQHPVGQGASARGDGQNARMHHLEAAARFTPLEVWEARNPWIMERCELAQDSCGAGRFRGGVGPDLSFRFLEDAYLISILERTKNAPEGLFGGLSGRPNGGELVLPDGTVRAVAKATAVPVPAGSVFTIRCGGGGGYGPPAERARAAVLDDLAEGYISERHARAHYPHAFAGSETAREAPK